MGTPIERIAALTIGTVESVSPSEIKVLLELDAPQATALNTGIPTRFPRVNSYVLIPNETGAVVGLITWLGVERSPFPKRTGLKDFGLIDLPFPLRKMSLTPVGTLMSAKTADGEDHQLLLKRGIFAFPSVGDPVLLPNSEQMRSIIEAQGIDRRVQIGISPLASNAIVSIDPDKLFGRHLAVLGNTGSGKSCSVAGLIRWSLESAANQRKKPGQKEAVNARFIILDPNGEYLETFSDLGARVFRVPPVHENEKPLSVPAWMWNSHEWSALSRAAPGTQRPLLLQGLREMRAGAAIPDQVTTLLSRRLRFLKARIEFMIATGGNDYTGWPGSRNCGIHLTRIIEDATRYIGECDDTLIPVLNELSQKAQSVVDSRYWKSSKNEGYNDFSETDLVEVLAALNKVIDNLPQPLCMKTPSEDAPIPFEVEQLADHLELLASGQASQFITHLTTRIRMMLADKRLGPIVAPDSPQDFGQWLGDYVGAEDEKNGQIAILDLSLIPSDVLHVVIAVIARIIFEAIQRYRKINRKELPTVLVLEEAHTFIQRRASGDEDDTPNPVQMCRQTFERIAREGRKFGLGLVLSSQRPSELSATALAQCNISFAPHCQRQRSRASQKTCP